MDFLKATTEVRVNMQNSSFTLINLAHDLLKVIPNSPLAFQINKIAETLSLDADKLRQAVSEEVSRQVIQADQSSLNVVNGVLAGLGKPLLTDNNKNS